MQSPELYGIVGGNECLLHLLKFQQRTSMKWYLITSLDDTSQVLSHFVHHYLHWILFHMTVGIAGTAKKHQFWNLLGELVVLILKPLQLLRSSLASWGISEIEPGLDRSHWQEGSNHPNLVAWGSALLHFLLDGSVTIVQLLDSLRNLCLALLPNGCSSTTGPTNEILANLCKCCTAFASQTNKQQTPPFPPTAGSCSQGGSWTAHTHGPPQSMSLGSANCILFCLHCEDFIWISSKHRV